MSETHPGNETYRDQVVRLSDLTLTTDAVASVTFVNCTIVGPAVIALKGTSSIVESAFDGSMDDVLWPLGQRDHPTGAIVLENCNLAGCRFERIGLAFPPDQEEIIRRGFVD